MLMSRTMEFPKGMRKRGGFGGVGVGLKVAEKIVSGEEVGGKEEVAVLLGWLSGDVEGKLLVGLKALQILLREAKWRKTVAGIYGAVLRLVTSTIVQGEDKNVIIVCCNCFSNLSHEPTMEVPGDGFVKSVVRRLVVVGGTDSKIAQSLLGVLQGIVVSKERRRVFWGSLIGRNEEGTVANTCANEFFKFLMVALVQLREDQKILTRVLAILVNLSNEEFGKRITGNFNGGSILASTFELLSAVPKNEIVVMALKLILNVGDVGRRKPNPRNLNKVADLVGTGDVKIASLAAEVVLVFAAGEGIGEILSDLIVCGVVKACLEDG